MCGKTFFGNGQRITCSQECSDLRKRVRTREYQDFHYMNDPDYRERVRQTRRQYENFRYHNDTEYREKKKALRSKYGPYPSKIIKPENIVMKTCVICNAKFQAFGNNKTCSEVCSGTRTKLRDKEKRKRRNQNATNEKETA